MLKTALAESKKAYDNEVNLRVQQLTAISTLTQCNTNKTLAEFFEQGVPDSVRSAAFKDVLKCVKREIHERYRADSFQKCYKDICKAIDEFHVYGG